MPKHNSDNFKMSSVEHISQEQVCIYQIIWTVRLFLFCASIISINIIVMYKCFINMSK